jgi:hypothetical protein
MSHAASNPCKSGVWNEKLYMLSLPHLQVLHPGIQPWNKNTQKQKIASEHMVGNVKLCNSSVMPNYIAFLLN